MHIPQICRMTDLNVLPAYTYILWQAVFSMAVSCKLPKFTLQTTSSSKDACGYSGGCDPPYEALFNFPLNLHDGQYDAPPGQLLGEGPVPPSGGSAAGKWASATSPLWGLSQAKGNLPVEVTCPSRGVLPPVADHQVGTKVPHLTLCGTTEGPSRSRLPGEELLPARCCFLFLPGADPRSTPKKPLALHPPNLHLRICLLGKQIGNNPLCHTGSQPLECKGHCCTPDSQNKAFEQMYKSHIPKRQKVVEDSECCSSLDKFTEIGQVLFVSGACEFEPH